ncbi:MAG: dienelactone hydrolase family protein [Myxococcaceae bacterium]|nr:dienelactone hydrolase family protein [Myxococcaceae bacterium]
MRRLVVTLLLFAMPALATMQKKAVSWTLGEATYEGVLVFDDTSRAPRPGLVMVPNWLGVTEAAVKQAAEVAGSKYVILVADVYGVGRRPKDRDEAGKRSGALKADRPELRARMAKALEVLRAQTKAAPLDTQKVGAIGFCFGGTAVLELARSGAAVAGVVSFHGGLSSPTPEDAKAIAGRVLVLHGADDPSVPPDEVRTFEDEMRAAKVDWQLVSYGNTVHSFTDPDANVPGRAQYNAPVAKRAFKAMNEFFGELFGG